MQEVLRVLLVEDSEDDALLIIEELRRSGFFPTWTQVETAEELDANLQDSTWDVIIADYSLPKFSAPHALEVLKQTLLDIPFIVVAGSIGELLAVEMMKSGADDYVMKDSLTRLPEAIRRAVRNAQIRAERQQAEVALKQQLAAIEAAIDGISILHRDHYLYVNRAHLKLFGYDDPNELMSKSWRVLYSAKEVARFETEIFPILERDRAWQGEAIATRKDGSSFVEGLSLTITEDDLWICVRRDISNLKQAQAEIIHNAFHDPLTDLPNRNLLLERLNVAIQRSQHLEGYRYAILFLDLDRFKVINDSLGHPVGDELLVELGKRLKKQIRLVDLVARLGGDEFVILLDDVKSAEEVVRISQKILAGFEEPFLLRGHEIFVSGSIGITIGNQIYKEAADLLRDADIAMYQAKVQGANSYKFFDVAMHKHVLQRLILETDLRKAIDHEDLTIRYQPIVRLCDRRWVGFEALVRWKHPERGFISPDNFIPIAEETGLIVPLDNLVFRKVCQEISRWKAKISDYFPMRVSVNLSVKDIRKTNFLEDIDAILSASGLSGDAITCEITEGILIEDIEEIIKVLEGIAARNISISIDDFGTGYSSLNYLHRLPVHHLKIDKSFVGQMQEETSNYKIVNTIIALSNQLGLTVVAEGIETEQQYLQLKQLGCQYGQGYLFSKPLTNSELFSTLENNVQC